MKSLHSGTKSELHSTDIVPKHRIASELSAVQLRSAISAGLLVPNEFPLAENDQVRAVQTCARLLLSISQEMLQIENLQILL